VVSFQQGGNGTFDVASDGSFTYTPDAGFVGTETVTYTITDGFASASGELIVAVENAAPELVGAGPFVVSENLAEAGTVTAEDPDGDALTFFIAGGADADVFDIDPDAGTLTFRNAPDFENPTDADDDNVYEVEIGVTDGIASTAVATAVTVTDEDEAGRTEIVGTPGNDFLIGTDADERFVSLGGGIDRMIGGGGADEFVFGAELDNGLRERDIIYDYGTDDTIVLASEDYMLSSIRNGVLIRHGDDGDLIYVLGSGLDEDALVIEIDYGGLG
jgi:hypothetical protein